MARPTPAHLDISNYPFSVEVTARFGDLDTMGHINNVAIAAMFETGRVHFHHVLHAHPGDLGLRWLVAAVSINYLSEMHFPRPVTIASAFAKIGNSSWTICSAAFQDGECCATCESVIVTHGPEGRRRVSDEQRERMVPWFFREPALSEG